MARAGFTQRASRPSPQSQASIDTSASHDWQGIESGNTLEQDEEATDEDGDGALVSSGGATKVPASVLQLFQFASTNGDISHLLDEAEVARIGNDAVREYQIDKGSRQRWEENSERYLDIAAQEDPEDDTEKDYPFEGASNVHYPILTTAAQQFGARAMPALVRGDKVVGVKAFETPPKAPGPVDAAKTSPVQPQNDQQAQAATAMIQKAQQEQAQDDAANQAKEARARRVAMFMNWTIFYQMPNWAGETDTLLHEAPVIGGGFKKIYMSSTGICSDYVSAMRLVVNNNTKSIYRCPRITMEVDAYPYEIDQKQRRGEYIDIPLPRIGSDPQEQRLLLEQHRLEDLDGDGLDEPYIVTVDERTRQTLRIEPAYGLDDVLVDETTWKVLGIERFDYFPEFIFLPDIKGRYYGMGFGKLLDMIAASVDASLNQLIDAGNAEIAGGGFMAGTVRLQGSGAAGVVYQKPGEFQTVAMQGSDLREAIWERTVPHPSEVTIKMMELLLAAAKDIASVKDVITGETPATAPVGTTLAVQDAALTGFTAVFGRMYRGFASEFRAIYKGLKRWGTDRERLKYKELTGGDFDEDFAGDGTDIQPVADPRVVTKQQKIARGQTLVQLAETEVGKAAGMTQAGPAKEIVREVLEATDWDRPERFVADVAPNPLEIAQTQEKAATAQLRTAEVKEVDARAADLGAQAEERGAAGALDHSKALREVGLAAKDTAELREHAHRTAHGLAPPNIEPAQPALAPPEMPELQPVAGAK